MEAGRCFTTSLFIGKSPQHAAGAAPESHDVKSSNKISADKQGEKRRGYHKKCNYKIEQNKQNHLYSRATLKTPWHSAKRAQSVCFVHAPPVGQWGFYKPVKKSPSLQALTLRSCRGAGCSCTVYQVLCDWQGTTEPALRPRHMKPPETPLPPSTSPALQQQKWPVIHTEAVPPGAAQARSIRSLRCPCQGGRALLPTPTPAMAPS